MIIAKEAFNKILDMDFVQSPRINCYHCAISSGYDDDIMFELVFDDMYKRKNENIVFSHKNKDIVIFIRWEVGSVMLLRENMPSKNHCVYKNIDWYDWKYKGRYELFCEHLEDFETYYSNKFNRWLEQYKTSHTVKQ